MPPSISPEFVPILRAAANPFDDDKVLTARSEIIDVNVNKTAYNKLIKELKTVLVTQRSRGVLIKGIAGSGKSHLISKLYQNRKRIISDDVLFFQVTALPGEATGWLRHILQSIVSDLEKDIGTDGHETQLSALIRRFILKHKKAVAGKGTSFKEMDSALEERYEEITREIANPIVEDVFKMLGNLYKWSAPFGKKKEEHHLKFKTATKWLKGWEIDEEELKLIGAKYNLRKDSESGDEVYLAILRTLGMITRSISPIILVFDQLDSMSDNTMNQFGKQLQALIGSDAAAPNYLILTAGVHEQMDRFEKEQIISTGAQDVIFKTVVELQPLTDSDCELIIRKRLDEMWRQNVSAHEPPNEWFPFTWEFLGSKLAANPIAPSPRSLLKLASSEFEAIQDVIDEAWLSKWPNSLERNQALVDPDKNEIEAFLKKQYESLIELNENGPISSDILANIIVAVVNLTNKFGGPYYIDDNPTSKIKFAPECFYTIARTGASISTALLFENGEHWKKVHGSLTKLLQLLRTFDKPHFAFFVRDAACKAPESWIQPKATLKALEATQRFIRKDLSAEEVAEISAMNKLRITRPDLCMPAAAPHTFHQITEEDLAQFFVERLITNCGLFQQIESVLSRKSLKSIVKSTETLPPQSIPAGKQQELAKAFLYSKMFVKKIYSYEDCLVEYVANQNRTIPTESDRATFAKAVEMLSKEKKIVALGSNPKILKMIEGKS